MRPRFSTTASYSTTGFYYCYEALFGTIGEQLNFEILTSVPVRVKRWEAGWLRVLTPTMVYPHVSERSAIIPSSSTNYLGL